MLDRRTARGRVRWFDRSLGYGFLWEDGNTKEIFVHQSSIQVPGMKKLRKGQRVVFDWCLTATGEMALNVIPICEREALLAKYRAKKVVKVRKKTKKD
ncbi:MAG: cold shock domain-containing protein [Proteobacteria bacterium]|nr:cold shock domain-containing protein [Pseudomonadota bacterium]